MAVDKNRAINDRYRISEKTFYSLSLAGGFMGIIVSMKLFNHKTTKIKFQLICLLSLVIWVMINNNF